MASQYGCVGEAGSVTLKGMRTSPEKRRVNAVWVRSVAIAVAGLLVAACGGGVSAPPAPVVYPPISVLPGTAVMYSGLPTTFLISGGTGSYIVTSSDQLVLPVSGPIQGQSLSVVPAPVLADTAVSLTVKDTGAAAPVSVQVSVRPNTVTNEIAILPSPTQDPSCSPALCSGSEAEVRFTVARGGFPLPGRLVQFEAVSGSFGLVGPSGVPGRVVTSTTDSSGVARARLRVDTLVASQTSLVRATDQSGGAFREASFSIARFTGDVPAFFAVPESVTFTGPFAGRCADATASEATVAVFGGVPPYSVVSGSSAFAVAPTGPLVLNRFDNILQVRVAGAGQCVRDVPVTISDGLGSTFTVKVSNVEGVGTAPVPNIALTPDSLSLSCSFLATNPTPPPATTTVVLSSSIAVSGGVQPFYVATAHPRLQVAVSGRVVTVSRQRGDLSGQLFPSTAQIVVSDGTRSAIANVSVPVNCP